MSDEVTLRVNGLDFAGWKEVEIVPGIERLARDFSLSVTSKWPGATDIPRLIKKGDLCEVFVGTDKLLTGIVDATPIRYDDKSLSVGVKGRSKTADLVDCSAVHKAGQWRNTRIEQIIADLAQPFGIEVVTEADTGAPVSEFQIQPGETVFECIDRLLTMRQLLCTDDAEGRVVIIKTGSGGRATTALEYGKNILSADSPLDYKDVFSSYTVNGQRAGTDNDWGDPAAGATATVADASVTRHRPLVIVQSGQVTPQICADRAKFEKVHRAAKALETSYTVQGWRQADGSLWLPNQIVRVVDPVIGFDGEFLIVEVALRKSDGGTTAAIKVGLESGYIPSPEATKKKKATSDSWVDVKPAK
ncbi:MAG: contractile injection system protein, VgrG/Pvc8 family [Sulfuritalea sp.]|jgi:prophage tail gpP-like protein|nr:contractile injection system protein, VgrG/Pvc8 family [Sulfuritalea sp.]